MEIRFKLLPKFDAALIARIKEKSNGSGDNLAARFLIRYWFENEKMHSLPQMGQHSDAPVTQTGQDEADLDEQIGAALASIGDEF